MGGCLGGYVRPPPAALPEKVSRPFKRRSNRRFRGQSVGSSQDKWMSSSNEMGDHNRSILNSQVLRHFSSSLNDCQKFGSTSTNNAKSSFENHALTNWHKQRQEWVSSQKPQSRVRQELVIRYSPSYEELLGTSRPFTEPVPLPEMVEFLVEVWEEEGLY